MFHNTIELPKSYYDNPQEYKRTMICNWKIYGVIYEDFDDLYEVYMNTMKCQHCDKTFETSFDRCLDHNHETGLFRMILCRGCNIRDSYLKYPLDMTTEDKKKAQNKAYREANKEKINVKVKCFFCKTEMSKKSLNRHYNEGRCKKIKKST